MSTINCVAAEYNGSETIALYFLASCALESWTVNALLLSDINVLAGSATINCLSLSPPDGNIVGTPIAVIFLLGLGSGGFNSAEVTIPVGLITAIDPSTGTTIYSSAQTRATINISTEVVNDSVKLNDSAHKIVPAIDAVKLGDVSEVRSLPPGDYSLAHVDQVTGMDAAYAIDITEPVIYVTDSVSLNDTPGDNKTVSAPESLSMGDRAAGELVVGAPDSLSMGDRSSSSGITPVQNAPTFEIIILSPAGTRRWFPQGSLSRCEGQIERYGGYGTATFETTMPYASRDMQLFDIVDVFFNGVRQYRGVISALVPTNEEPPKLTIETYGKAFAARKLICLNNYAYPSGSLDVADAFSLIANDVPMAAKSAGGYSLFDVLDTETIGSNALYTMSAKNSLFGDVIDTLITSASNLCIWGADVDGSDNDRLYIRPVGQKTHVIVFPGQRVESASAEQQAGDLINQVIIKGGAPTYGQYLTNGDFSNIVYEQDGAGNMLENGNFDVVSNSVASGWTFSSSAALKTSSGNSNFVELDTTRDWISQSRNYVFVAGNTYKLTFWTAQEIEAQSISAYVTLTLFNSSGAQIAEPINLTYEPSEGNIYICYSESFIAPIGAASFTVKFGLNSISSYMGNSGGLEIDNVMLFNASIVYQSDWTTEVNAGSNTVEAVNWNYPDSPVGGKCVMLDMTASNASGQDSKFTIATLFAIGTGPALRVSCWVKSPPTSLNLPDPDLPIFFLELRCYNGSGNEIEHYGGNSQFPTVVSGESSAMFTPSSMQTFSEWTYCEMLCTLNDNNISSADVNITYRSNGSLLVALFSVQNQAATSMGVGGAASFQPYGNCVFNVQASDAGLGTWYSTNVSGSSSTPGTTTPPYAASQATYGTFCSVISNNNVTTIEDAYALAHNQFVGSAGVAYRPSVVLIGNSGPYWPGDYVSLQGALGASLCPTTLPIVRVKWDFDGILKTTLEMEREAADENLVTQRLVMAQIDKYNLSNS
jgi:hypothetical protein